MKKYLSIALFSTLLSFSFAYAHDTGVPHEEPAGQLTGTAPVQATLVPIPADGRKPVIVRSGTAIEGRAMIASGTPGEPRGQIIGMGNTSGSMRPPQTGDPATDAKILALNKEMEIKIKAIRDEYTLKIKAIIGDKKVLPVGASTTMVTGARHGEMEQHGNTEVHTGKVQGASTNIPDQPEGQPTGGFFLGLFKGLFGR